MFKCLSMTTAEALLLQSFIKIREESEKRVDELLAKKYTSEDFNKVAAKICKEIAVLRTSLTDAACKLEFSSDVQKAVSPEEMSAYVSDLLEAFEDYYVASESIMGLVKGAKEVNADEALTEMLKNKPTMEM